MTVVKVKKSQRGENLPVTKLVPPQKPRKQKVFVDEQGDEIPVEEFEDLEDIEDSQKLDEFRQLFGDRQYFLRVERLNEESNEMELCDKVFLNSFDPLLIGKKYGGGKFVASLFTDGGKYVKGGRMRFTIAKPLDAAPGPEKNSNPMDNPMWQMVIEQMKSEKAMLAALIEKMVTKDAPPPAPMTELLGALKSLQDLSPKEKDKNPMKEMLEMMTLQKQIRDLVGGDKEDSPGLLSEITEALKLLPTLRGMKPPVPRPADMRPNGAPRPSVAGLPIVSAPPQPETSLVPTKPVSPAVEKILFYVPKFVEAGTRNDPPEKWSDFLISVLDNEVVPALVIEYHGFVDADNIWERLIQASEDPEKINKIFEFAPALEPVRDWCLQVIGLAVKEMTENETANVNGSGEHE